MVQTTKTAQLCDILAEFTLSIHYKPCGIGHITGNEQRALETGNNSLATAKTGNYIYEQR